MKSSMPCPTWAEKLAARHHNDLSLSDRVALQEHLTSCAVCATIHSTYHTLEFCVRSLPAVEPLSGLSFQLSRLEKSPAPHTWLQSLPEAKFVSPLRRPTPYKTNLPQYAVTIGMAMWSVVGRSIQGLKLSERVHAALAYFSQRTIYASSGSNSLYALQGKNGPSLWTYKKSDVFFSAPAVEGGQAYLTPLDAQLFLFSLKPFSMKPHGGSFLWKR